MKATGIVRRIDELGRVVVPKEIRRTLRIREGDPLEIFTNRDGEVILKKYSPIGELDNFAKQYEKMSPQEQIIYLSEAEKIFKAFDKVPDGLWEEEYDKYKEVLSKYKDIRMMRWSDDKM